MRAAALILLRVSLGLFLLVWGGDKLVNAEHGVAVSDRFYLGLMSGRAVLLAVGVLEIVFGVLVVLGLARRISYGGLLLVAGATLLAVWKSILDPLELVIEGGNPVFFASLIVFAGSLVLWAFRDDDLLSLDARRSAYGRAPAAKESPSLARS